MKYMRKQALLFLLTIFSITANIHAYSTGRPAQVLDEVWNEVSKRHFNKNFKKDYQELYKKFKPEILKSGNDTETAFRINKLLHALGQSHIVLMPPADSSFSKAIASIKKNTAPIPDSKIVTKKPALPDLPADIGITVSQIKNYICVIRVKKDSPAEKAGIKMGDIILSINNINLAPGRKDIIGWPLVARALLSGRPGTEVELITLNSKNIKQKIILKRRINGEKWFKMGLLPRSYSDFYATILAGNVGYVQFTAFTTPMLQRFRKIMTGKLKNTKALIIDMRGNIGGILMFPPWLAAWCYPRVVAFGEITINGTVLKPKSTPQPECFKGPVAVLTDNYSYSCAEMFAAGMQDAKAAVLFGTTTSGDCLPSIFLKLPSGFRLQTITGNITRPNGGKIEGIGVKPDKEVVLSIKALREGKDNVIEAARFYLLNKK
jgi:C-terminal peptidase prc